MRSQSHVWDNPTGKGITNGRRIARFLSSCACYNPSIRRHRKADYRRAATESIEDGGAKKKMVLPLLDRGWAYFEHLILPRYFRNENGRLNRAKPGESEKETRLYPLWATSMEDLGDFGEGVGLYFTSLRYFALVTLVAGLINIPNMIYFASDEYTGGKENGWSRFPNILSKWILKGSAICTNTAWKACPSCTSNDWHIFPSTNDRFAYNANTEGSIVTCSSPTNSTSSIDDSPLTFIKKNNCVLHDHFGEVSIVTLFFVLVAVFCFMFTQKKRATEFDEAEQSSSDYSIVITNSPNNAKDPEIWKEFFESKFKDVHVSACTIALNNDLLINTLVRRRKLLLQLQDIFPVEESFDENDLDNVVEKCPPVPAWKKWFCLGSDAKDIHNTIRNVEKQIRKLSQNDYNVSNVFVTFETQHAQQKVLESMSVPILRKYSSSNELKFEGKVLRVSRPSEPSGKSALLKMVLFNKKSM